MRKKETPGERIAALRHAAGMSQAQLAELLGISGPSVCQWERDKAYPSIQHAIALCRIFGTTVEEVFGD